MFDACAPLGTKEQMLQRQKALSAETIAAGDAIEAMVTDAMAVTDKKLPLDERQKRLQQLLALDDSMAIDALKGAFARPGTKLDGQTIPEDALRYYGAAWDLVNCANFGACRGVGSNEALLECAHWSRCDFADTWTKVDQLLPPMSRDKVEYFFRHIQANLAARNYQNFTVP